ncbi:MAG: AI-2E family transporter [Rhodothermales bacterium]
MKNANLALVLLGVLAVFVLGVTLQELRAVLLPFSVALLLSVIFEPVVVFLKARKFPTILSLVMVLLTFALVLFLIGLLIYSSVGSFTEAWPNYETKLESMVSGMEAQLEQWAVQAGVDWQDLDVSDLFQASTVTSVVSSGVGSFINFVGNTFLVILFMLFMLAATGDLSVKVERAFPSEYAERIAHVIRNTSKQVRQYLVTKTLVSAGTGTLVFLILLILGVDFPLLWGFLAFLLNFIPNIGSLVAVFFPFLLSLLQFDTLTRPVFVIVLLVSVQMVMGNVVEPRLMAFSLNLSPLLVLVSLIFWGWLWGILGMILAVPLTATIKIIFENIEPLRPVAVLMGGPISPRE